MANSLEFSRFGDPIEGRYDGYGEFLADSLPGNEDMDPAHLIPDCIDYNAELFELQKQLESEQADLIATTRNLLAAMASELDKMADGNPFASALLNRYHGDAPAMPALTEIDDDFDPFATVEGEGDEDGEGE